MPSLTAQAPQYFVASMLAYEEGGRGHKLMQRLAGDLDEATLSAMGLFYAVQEPVATETTGDGDAVAGRALADERCADCHGEDGNASGAEMPTLAGQDARYFIKAMQAYRDGSRPHRQMQEAVDGLSDTDVANLGTFYATQTPVRRDVRMPLTTAEWIDRCERCHGIDGNSTDPRFPMLAGQDPDYLEAALRAYAAEGRQNSIMHAMSDPLSEADVLALARHYASQVPRGVVYMQIPCEEAEQ
jgi:cytochrome c553